MLKEWMTMIGMGAMSVAVFVAGCGGGSNPVCGNGKKESGETCDCGEDPNNLPEGCRAINGAPRSTCSNTCTLLSAQYTTLEVKWSLNGQNSSGGSFDTCSDVGVSMIHLHVEGPAGFMADKTTGCTSYQDSWYESNEEQLPSGNYTVTATPMYEWQAVGEPQVATGIVQIDLTNTIDLDFPFESFFDHETMTGDLLLTYDFDGSTCGDASPVVSTEKISVFVDDELLVGFPMTRECSDAAWIHNGLPAGEARVRLEGLDNEDSSGFCIEEVVKIGIGGNLPFVWHLPPVSEGICTGP